MRNRKLITKCITILASSLILLHTNAFANLEKLRNQNGYKVAPITLSLTPGKYRWGKIAITNLSNAPYYFNITLKKRKNGQYKLIRTTQSSILISPKQLIIPKHTTKYLRIGLMKKRIPQEEIYQLAMIPVNHRLIIKQSIDEKRNINGALSVIIGVAVRILVLPNNPKIQIILKKNKKKLSIHNRGNVTVKLYNIQQCPTTNKCHSIHNRNKTLYPNKTWKITLPSDDKVKLTQEVGRQSSTLTAY